VTASQPARTRRRYDSSLRRERSAQTRDRIVGAASALLREADIRDWDAITIRSVAARAGVNERTVYRHFAHERALRDAVMHRLEVDAGIDLTRMRLEDIADVATRIFEHLSSYPLHARTPLDPTLAETSQRQHEALLAAIGERVPRWSAADRRLAAATFDVLWSVASYERLVLEWQMEDNEAIRAIAWVIGLVESAVREGRPPSREKRQAHRAH
jgi:AcrR family transcriptional regulator